MPCGAGNSSVLLLAILSALALGPSSTSAKPLPYPPLTVLHGTLLTTANSDFEGHDGAFAAAANWHSENTLQKSDDDQAAPYFACTAPSILTTTTTTAPPADTQAGVIGHHTLSRLQSILNSQWSSGKDKVRVVSNSDKHGVCFVATATLAEAEGILTKSSEEGLLVSWVPFPSVLKLAPGLLNHNDNGEGAHEGIGKSVDVDSNVEEGHHKGRKLNAHSKSNARRRLTTTHGDRATIGDEVHGLEVELAPGLLPARRHREDAARGASSSDMFAGEWGEDLMSEKLDLYGLGFWSDASMSDGADGHLARPGGAVRAREWTRAADVVHELSSSGGPTPGEVCSWDELVVYHTDDDLLTVKGARAAATAAVSCDCIICCYCCTVVPVMLFVLALGNGNYYAVTINIIIVVGVELYSTRTSVRLCF